MLFVEIIFHSTMLDVVKAMDEKPTRKERIKRHIRRIFS